MTMVRELRPGDILPGNPGAAVFIASATHPLWPSLQLVVWKMADGTWSFDALAARQEVGIAAASTAEQRAERLRTALLAGQQVPASGVAATVRTEWCVAYGGEDANDCAGLMVYDDQGEAEEMVQWITGGFLARRTVTEQPWERP